MSTDTGAAEPGAGSSSGPGAAQKALGGGLDKIGPGSKKFSTPLGKAPLIPVSLILIGAYIAWFAVHFWESDVKWPSDPIKSLATGKGLPATSANNASYESEIGAIFTNADNPTGASSSAGGGTTPGAAGAAAPVSGAYSHAQLEALWKSSGGDPATANKAAAIAQAESSGNPAVTSGNPDGGTNVGLWQLDTPGGKGAGHTIAELQDPATNARVAIMGSANGSNWSAWATAVGSNPAYLIYMASSQ
jgi:hypothetical protein